MPVEEKVAAILRATWPDLPMPLTMTRPFGGQDHADGVAEIAVQRLRKARQGLAGRGQHPARGRQVARGGFAGNGMQGGLGARHITLCFNNRILPLSLPDNGLRRR